jgi:hypothetical protein
VVVKAVSSHGTPTLALQSVGLLSTVLSGNMRAHWPRRCEDAEGSSALRNPGLGELHGVSNDPGWHFQRHAIANLFVGRHAAGAAADLGHRCRHPGVLLLRSGQGATASSTLERMER